MNIRESVAALQSKVLQQAPESVVRDSFQSGRFAVSSPNVDETPAPESIQEEYELYETTGIVSGSIDQYARDVTEPGYRVTAANEQTETWFNEEFLPQAGIVGGQRHQDFGEILQQSVIMYLAAGNILVENVKNDGGDITGFLHINPASCQHATEPNKPILLDPEATEEEWFDGEETKRGEAAAFLQYHPQSVLGRRGDFEDREIVPLSLNDVTFRPRNPQPGTVWGIPLTRNIRDEVTEFLNIRQDLAHAIKTKAFGIWSVSFDKEIIETDQGTHIEEWSEDDMDDFAEGIGVMGPGEIITHDGDISFEQFSGDIPEEVLDTLEAYVKMIVSRLPTPLYAVGFEDNINQFVVKEQETIYDSHVDGMQRILEETFTPTLKQVAEDHGKNPEGVELHIDTGDDESPIRTMEIEDVEKFALYADGLSSLLGQNAFRAFNPKEFSELVALLPEEAFKSETFLGAPGGNGPSVREMWMLDEVTEPGRSNGNTLESIRSRLESITDPGEEANVSMPGPFGEQTGGGMFASDDDDERDQDGKFAGSDS